MLQIWRYWQAGGLLLIPIAVVCFALWLYFLRSRARLRQVIADGHNLRDELACGGDAWSMALLAKRLQRQPGVIAGVLYDSLNDVLRGASATATFEAHEAACLRGLSRDFVVLAALTGVAPLLGLLGTVNGMIHTFDAVALIGGNTGEQVAEGISRALITTQFGLVVALPGVFGMVRLRRMRRTVQVVMASCRTYLNEKLAGMAAGAKERA